MTINLKELETLGYTIIPNFLSKECISSLFDQYQTTNNLLTNKNYKVVSGTPNKSLYNAVNLITKCVNRETSIKVSVIPNSLLFLNSSLINFNWHQDHESYYRWQDSYNSLNFWIPLVKENKLELGLEVIPHCNIDPEISKKYIVGKGARRFINIGNRTKIIDDETGDVFSLNLNFDALKHTPQVGVGDLLLMRGDIIHRSQPCNFLTNSRVAISIYAFNGDKIISKERFLSGCQTKQEMIQKNISDYAEVISSYEKFDFISVRDVLA